MAYVLIISDANGTREFRLTQPVTSLGRSPDNVLQLPDERVSRFHAQIAIDDAGIAITDLGSANGTALNGVELEPRVPTPLKPGDIIKIPPYTLTLNTHESPAPSAGVPAKTSARPAELCIPVLRITTTAGTQEIRLSKDSATMGRNKENDIVVDDPSVSRVHARIDKTPDGYVICDLNSTNGLTFKSELITSKLLEHGDQISIAGNVLLTYAAPQIEPYQHIEPTPIPDSAIPTMSFKETPLPLEYEKVEQLSVKGQTTISIGRSADSDIVLSHPTISRRHARVFRVEDDDTYMIEDSGSTHGTFVNGTKITSATRLSRGDTITIGPVQLVFTPETITKTDQSRNIRVDALHINKRVSKNVNLLQDISLTIQPNEFVAIVGGSGAGKSTLLKALIGFNPASDGSVLINGDDLYRNFEAHRSQFGFVPQEDIIHRELSVYEALDYSARLRLPADTSASDRHKRIMEVLNTLDLTERKDLQIKKLSGGQLKRVSIGVELLTQPGLFCLDEATSGLDPGIESQMMRLFRKLSDRGHTILLVTHATQNVMLCDMVVFLARGGYLAFYGPPDKALAYFNVQDFNSIYEKLEKEFSPQQWSERFKQTPYYQKYIVDRAPSHVSALPSGPRKSAAPGSRTREVSAIGQFSILSRRNMNILFRDKVSLILMLVTAPILSLLFFILARHGMLEPDGGDASKFILSVFQVSIMCFLVGGLAFMREIVKEADIYRRERMVTLKIEPYILSKLWVAGLLALYQAIVFVIVFKIASGWPDASQIISVFITLVLGSFAAMVMGLLISAISPNPNVTPLLIIFVLIPQFLFGGIQSVEQYGPIGEPISKVISTKWSFESLVTISGLGKNIATDPCWQLSEDERSALTPAQKEADCDCMGISIFENSNFPGIYDFYVPEIDQPEPVEPVHPGDPPPEPDAPPGKPGNPPNHPGAPPAKPSEALLLINPILYWQEMQAWNVGMTLWQQQMNQYATEMKAWESEMGEYGEEMKDWEQEMNLYKEAVEDYQDLVSQYQDDMEQWQSDYKNWKESRDTAVGKAEGLISYTYEEWGSGFNVSVPGHWMALVIITGSTFILLLIVMRIRDRKR